ncbi:uncharacterized protein LACBIDRAFT_323974 [Laccaria bicolor S238N-H82]|uniref:Predicted protein n=1 Tax=Laccaria bicolor (strain S238N-H82 / ATCC MYA-4686) TaxID=486041 RepID=B0D083_LACBS|nr:uncharacterized protein LACBIDRAFT_323974 [Laccaria bicolor S238N-H82]EDR11785.1 predicted protein [Laccaria bicolor S238N-H82]|eukprot:XP_001877682.1 predicted protein [Laccaria bicolor S238N-H82]
MTIVSLNHDGNTTGSDSGSVPAEKLGKHSPTCLRAPGNSQGIMALETPQVHYRGTPTSVVPLTIPTSPADHRMLSAAKAVPPGSPSASHTPSMAYPSPLSATTPSAASHTPQTARLGPHEVAVSSASSSTALYAPTMDPPTSTTTPPLAELKRGHSKGSDSSPVSVDFGKMLVSGTPSRHEGPSFQAPCRQKYQMHGSRQPSDTNQMLIVVVVIVTNNGGHGHVTPPQQQPTTTTRQHNHATTMAEHTRGKQLLSPVE